MNAQRMLLWFVLVLLTISCNSNNSGGLDAKKLYFQGCQLLRKEKLNQAEEVFSSIMEKYPESNYATQANQKLDEVYDLKKKLLAPKKIARVEKKAEEPIVQVTVRSPKEKTPPPLNTPVVKPSRLDEIKSYLEFVKARLEEHQDNRTSAKLLYQRLCSIYPYTVGATYAKLRLENPHEKEHNWGASTRLYRQIVETIEHEQDYQRKRQALSKLSQQKARGDVLALHNALLEIYIEVEAFSKVLAQEKKELNQKNIAHFLNSHLFARDVEWSQQSREKINHSQQSQLSQLQTSNVVNQSSGGWGGNLDLSLKSLIFGDGIGVGLKNESSSQNASQQINWINQAQNSSFDVDKSSATNYSSKVSAQAETLRIETLSVKVKESYSLYQKLLSDWYITAEKWTNVIYSDPEVKALHDLEVKMILALKMQEWTKAEKISRELLAIDDESIPYRILDLQLKYLQKNYGYVIQEGNLYKNHDTSHQVHYFIGLAHLKKKNPSEATHHLSLAYQHNKNYSPFVYALMCSYTLQKDFKTAYRYLEQIRASGFSRYEVLQKDSDVDKRFLSYPPVAKLLRDERKNKEKQRNKSEVESQLKLLLENREYEKARVLFEEKAKGNSYLDRSFVEKMGYEIYYPLAKAATEKYQASLKGNNHVIENQREALGYFQKIPAAYAKTNEVTNLKQILEEQHFVEYFSETKLYSLKYPAGWEAKEEPGLLFIKASPKEERGAIMVYILHETGMIPYVNKEQFQQVIAKIAPLFRKKIETLVSHQNLLAILGNEQRTEFFKYNAINYPLSLIKKTDNSKWGEGKVTFVHGGEYVFVIFAAYGDKQALIEKSLSAWQFHQKFSPKKSEVYTIDATPRWQEIPGEFNSGETLGLRIVGNWSSGGLTPKQHGPEGTQSSTLSGESIIENGRLGSLMYKFTPTEGNFYGGEITERSFEITVPSKGTLAFSINDNQAYNNSGKLTIAMRRFHKKLLGINVIKVIEGFRVLSVVPGSDAEIAGVLPGDTVTKVEQNPIESIDDILRGITWKFPGSTVEVEIRRDNKLKTLYLVVSDPKAKVISIKKEQLEGSPPAGTNLLSTKETKMSGTITLTHRGKTAQGDYERNEEITLEKTIHNVVNNRCTEFEEYCSQHKFEQKITIGNKDKKETKYGKKHKVKSIYKKLPSGKWQKKVFQPNSFFGKTEILNEPPDSNKFFNKDSLSAGDSIILTGLEMADFMQMDLKNIIGKLKLTFTGTRIYQKERVAVFQITFQADAEQETEQNLIAKVSFQLEGEILYSLKNNIFALKDFSGPVSISTNTAENVQMIVKGTMTLKEEAKVK